MADEHGLDFGGTEPLSGDLDRVVGATENVPEPILVHRSPIPVDPDVGESAPVRLKITIGIFPETARHADPRLADDKLAHLSTNRRSFFIYDIGGDARHGSGKRAGLKRRQNVPRNETARSLSASRIIDNRQAAPSGGVKKPEPRIRIPGLSRGAENAQGRKVMLLCGGAAVTHETANQSRRDAENAHPMALDERPQTIRPRKIQSSFVKNHRRAEKGCTKNFPRPHHPSHVRHPVKHVLFSDIEAKQHVLSGLDRKSAVRVKRPFRPSGRSRGVNDHQRIFSVGPFRFRLIALFPALSIPPPSPTRIPRTRNPNPPKTNKFPTEGKKAKTPTAP